MSDAAVIPASPAGPWWKEITRNQWYALLAGKLGWMLDAFDVMLYVFCLKVIMDEWHLNPATAGFMVTVTLFASSFGGILFGAVADKWGRKNALMATVLIFSICSGLSGLSQNLIQLAIARTILKNPPVLVLDAATSAIDVQVEQTIHAGLKVQMEGRTTLIIAHRLSTISLADRVVLLDQHKVVADGTHADLLATTPLYAEVLAQAAEYEAEEERDEAEADPAGNGNGNGNGNGDGTGSTPLGDMLDAVRGGAR